MLVWIYADGAHVKKDDILLEVTVEKAQLEIRSPATGRLTIIAHPETIIRLGDTLGTIETD